MMKTLVFWLLFGALIAAQDPVIDLTVPVVPPTPPTLSGYTRGALTMQIAPRPYIQIVLVGTNDQTVFFTYPCAAPCDLATEADVLTFIEELNTADMTTRSLWQRISDRLLLDFPERFPGGAVVQ